jgi:iron(III) transport system ATP-binding protein
MSLLLDAHAGSVGLPDSAALSVTAVSKSFGTTSAVADVSFELPAGELMAILGPSGCGKSTLLRIIAGLERPDAGTVGLNGRDITRVPVARRRIALVPQEGALFPHLSVAQNIAFGLAGTSRLFGLRGAAARPEVRELLELLRIGELADRMPAQISGGQAQRVALARALACNPELVLLDEPFSALDASLRQSVRTDVRRTLNHLGVAAIVVTHDQEEALSLADRVAVMRAGRIAQVDTPAEVYRNPANAEVARLVGSAVLLSGHRAVDRVLCCLGDVAVAAGTDADGLVMLRPEQLMVLSPTSGLPTGEVEAVTFFGHDADVTVRLDSGESVQARVQGDLPGGRVSLQVRGKGRFFPVG